MTLKTPLLLASAALLALTACTDPAVQTNDPNQRTKEGVALGGLLGAITGAAVSDNKGKGAVIGGILGAGAGAAIGYNLDKQAAELQRDFDNGRIQIINNGSSLVVRMPQDILFATDSAAVNPTLQSDLRVLANSLQRYPASTVQVVGHTDNTGSASYNQDLSVRRANSVASVLIGAGVPSRRIQAYGQGEDAPIASNLTAEGRAKNRRVDITIIPNSN
ncbi:OmpA family protein [Psychromarinibacter sp. C21-152]|uniref:OmpA family protein n=1 Tax=Psychromarinibacter sediminicola TaxID=3033385 RepID=A0AAE3NTJ0_9RHOB|nr:OmpA family protein [Psychromarinibacter sediminicola]MDF0601781.1 OmpA family protein [Psychromarinibacter sediminicola]